MKPAPFAYYDPASVAEASALLARHENARLLAGGQSLMPMMNFRYVTPDHLIDLNKIASLAGITVKDGALRFGAMTRQRDIEFSAEVKRLCPVMREALAHVGHRQTRNRGTIGGSLCHLDPAAELVNLAALHDGTLEAESARGKRVLAFDTFAAGFMATSLEPDEILTAVTLKPWSARHGYAFLELARRHGDFAIVAASALLELDPRGRIARAALALSGIGPVPARPEKAVALLKGAVPAREAFLAAAEEASKIEAMSDAYYSAAYRQHLARVLTRRALEEAARRAAERSAA
ncbi:MAG TPA: FAD binding domain-containing protein [Stellaceae bacterium]|nr:FAD binding domain-containing protein [Stellaceae bacterium]